LSGSADLEHLGNRKSNCAAPTSESAIFEVMDAQDRMRALSSVLVVEDDDLLRDALADGFRDRGLEPVTAGTVADALAALENDNFDALVTDVRLPDGSGADVAAAASRKVPAPLTVAISGKATPAEAFDLSRVGVLGYLAKPATFADLWAELERVATTPPDLSQVVNAHVGHTPMPALQSEVRKQMIGQALALAGDNTTSAAKMLKVSRQAVQQMRKSRSEDEN
jgi:DNA-binding NtrC family response regulator